jgi:AI-2 transport protein TqsA
VAVSQAQRRSDITLGTLLFIAVLLGAFAIKFTRPLSAPLAFAFFAALVLQPVRASVARRMPRRLRFVGVLSAVMLLVLALALLGGAVALAVSQATQELPLQADRFGAILEPVRSWAEERGIRISSGGQSILERAAQGSAVALKATSGAIGFLVLSVFFVVLMLSEVGQWREKLLRVLRGEAARVLDAAAASASGVRRYLLAVTVVGFLTAVFEGGFLLLIGVKLALVWALLFFLLNYVPYVGSIIAAVPPVLFVLATQGLRRGLLVALGILVIEQVMGNLVAPIVEGKGTKLSPLVVLAAVTFWGWAWGAVGALLAVPITVTLMMLCARIPALERVAVVLGGEADQEV